MRMLILEILKTGLEGFPNGNSFDFVQFEINQ